MCTVSMIGDDWTKRYPGTYPWAPLPSNPLPQWPEQLLGPTRAEFDALKQDVENLRKLLLAAKEYDAATGQPDCEVDDKVTLIRRIAEWVGVDFSDVFPAKD